MSQSFGFEINKFVDQIISIKETFPLLQKSITDSIKMAEESLTSFLEDTPPSSNSDYFIELKSLKNQLKNVKLSNSFLPSAILVSLVSQYDAYFGKILRLIFNKKPETLKDSQKETHYGELVQFESLDEIKNFLIEKEIESVLRENHKKQIEWLEKKIGTLRKRLEIWPKFIELTERRNLFVHADGVVSSQYIKVCKENGHDLEEECKVGRRLYVTKNYFINSFECIFEMSVKLGHVVWRKIDSGDCANADESLNDLCHFLIENEEYRLALALLDFALTTPPINKNLSDEIRLLFLINKAQTLKWSGQEGECEKLLESRDWSTLGLKYKLAKAVLSEDYEESSNLMKSIHQSGEVSSNDYRILPIYKKFRKTNQFKSTFKEIFGEYSAYVDIEEEKEIIGKHSREFDQLIFDIKENFTSLVRRICVTDDNFPPIEIHELISKEKLFIYVNFAPSTTHKLKDNLTILFSIDIIDSESKNIQIGYTYYTSDTPKYGDIPEDISLFFEGGFDEGVIWNELDSIFHSMIEKVSG